MVLNVWFTAPLRLSDFFFFLQVSTKTIEKYRSGPTNPIKPR